MKKALATIEKIISIIKHPNADRLYIATVNGWQCVTAEPYQVDDLVIYIQIDTTIPRKPWSEFLFKDAERQRERLKSIKLRGAVSQGLLLPVVILPDPSSAVEGADVSDLLEIQKYEKPIEGETLNPKGNFPHHLVPKTDEERIQNYTRIITDLVGTDVYISLKCDGMSGTFIKLDGMLTVCSRNLELKDGNNHYWSMARKYNLAEVMNEGEVIQSEIIGPGIQKNHAGDSEVTMRVFNVGHVHTVSNSGYFDYDILVKYCNDKHLPMVPVLYTGLWKFDNLQQLLDFADAQKYWNGAQAEGIVIRTLKESRHPVLGRLSFKVISNKFAIKHGE